jgi:hypothetical protein
MVEQEGAESRSTAWKRDSVHERVEMCYGWTRQMKEVGPQCTMSGEVHMDAPESGDVLWLDQDGEGSQTAVWECM